MGTGHDVDRDVIVGRRVRCESGDGLIDGREEGLLRVAAVDDDGEVDRIVAFEMGVSSFDPRAVVEADGKAAGVDGLGDLLAARREDEDGNLDEVGVDVKGGYGRTLLCGWGGR